MTYVRLLSLVVAEKGLEPLSSQSRLVVLCIGAGNFFAFGKIYGITHTSDRGKLGQMNDMKYDIFSCI